MYNLAMVERNLHEKAPDRDATLKSVRNAQAVLGLPGTETGKTSQAANRNL